MMVFKKKGKLLSMIILCLALGSTLLSTGFAQETGDEPVVYSIEIEGIITAGTTAYIRRSIETAEEDGAEALLILLNTPGGLVDATLDIVSDMINADVPIITYVYPQGGISASAGTFILLGGHKAAMSPGTTIGAAMPVMVTPDEGSAPADDKTVIFLAGHMKSIAEARGRPADIAERFVTENLTLGATEALELTVIDEISTGIPALLSALHGEEVSLDSGVVTLSTENARIEEIEQTLREVITNLISNPQVAFILFLVGVYGLIIGFNAPGTFVPEVLGAIALILALYGLGMFEVNIFAALMILLGMALLVVEAFTPSFGILGIGGIISMVFGILYLPVEPLVSERWLMQFRILAIGIGVIASVLLIVILAGVYRLKKAKVIHGDDEFAGDRAVVAEEANPKGLILVRGELWEGKSLTGDRISEGTPVRIIKREGLVCMIEPVSEEKEADHS